MNQDDAPPLIRASQVKANLKSLKLLGQEKEARVLGKLKKTTIETIEKTNRLAWLPQELDLELNEVVLSELGEQDLRAWSIESIIQSVDGPLLGPLFQGVIRLFGISPMNVYRHTERAWKSIYQNCGEYVAEKITDQEALITIKNLPLHLLDNKSFLVGVEASLEAIYQLTSTEGTMSMEIDKQNRALCFKATWGKI